MHECESCKVKNERILELEDKLRYLDASINNHYLREYTYKLNREKERHKVKEAKLLREIHRLKTCNQMDALPCPISDNRHERYGFPSMVD